MSAFPSVSTVCMDRSLQDIFVLLAFQCFVPLCCFIGITGLGFGIRRRGDRCLCHGSSTQRAALVQLTGPVQLGRLLETLESGLHFISTFISLFQLLRYRPTYPPASSIWTTSPSDGSSSSPRHVPPWRSLRSVSTVYVTLIGCCSIVQFSWSFSFCCVYASMYFVYGQQQRLEYQSYHEDKKKYKKTTRTPVSLKVFKFALYSSSVPIRNIAESVCVCADCDSRVGCCIVCTYVDAGWRWCKYDGWSACAKAYVFHARSIVTR